MFHIYGSGSDFLADNREIMRLYPLETVFFKVNADNLTDMSKGFAAKAYNDRGEMMIGIRFADFPMVIFGDKCVIKEFAEGLAGNSLHFTKVLGNPDTADAFLRDYEELAGGKHRVNLSMDIMKCSHISAADTSGVEKACTNDIEELAELLAEFNREAVHTDIPVNEAAKKVKNSIDRYYLIRREGRIASAAEKLRETEYLCSISTVFTVKEFRGKGLARQTVAHITKEIIDRGKTAICLWTGQILFPTVCIEA
ncbi:MAG: GNAT family N-acetyltransferase [Ruminococcus sp.]|nr:GNAT family N-acetyltransferase [Ruminococcus sp.]